MTPAQKLTRRIERQISDDWQHEIRSLGVYRPRQLLRRVDPLLVGICLDRDSSGNIYKPCFHVHNLCCPDTEVSLDLWSQLRSGHSGGPDYIEVTLHEERYREAAQRMVAQSLLPLDGDLQLDGVIETYRQYMSSPVGLGLLQRPTLYRDMILLLAWARRGEHAAKVLREATSALGRDDSRYLHLGGRKEFETNCRDAIARPEVIDETIRSEVEKHELESLPVARMVR